VTGTVEPKMNFYPTSSQPVPTPQVNSSIGGDLYANLQAFKPDGSSATIRLIYEPLVPWIWFGGLIVVIGSVLSILPAQARAGAAAEAYRAPVGLPKTAESDA
jgi:cytochrome c-type biogenesis protein CcmF